MFKIGDKVRYIFNPPRFHPIPNAKFGDVFIVTGRNGGGDVFIQGYDESFDIRRFQLEEAAPLPDDDVNNRIDVQGNEMKYKAGDFVVWQDAGYGAGRHALTVGKIYKIARIHNPRIVYLINDNGREISSLHQRFTKWIPKVGDVVKALNFENHPNKIGVGWLKDMEGQVGMHLVVTGVAPINGNEGNLMVELNNRFVWPVDGGIEPINVADAPAKALDEPVQGFNARVKGLVAAKKKKPIKPSKAAIMKKLKAELVKHRMRLQAESTGKETASYAICFEDGGANMRGNTACHAGLNLYGDQEVVALYDHVGKYYDNPNRIPVDMRPAFKKFVLFLMKRSPIAHAFKTKTWTEAYAKGMDMDVSKTGSELAVACCSLRFAHEHSGRIEVWDWCLKNKYDELTAYFMMNVAVKVAGAASFYVDVRNWHNIVDGEKSFQGMVERMVKGFHDAPGKSPYSEHQSYKVSALVHGTLGGKSLRTVLSEIIPMMDRPAWGGDPNKWNEKQFRTVCDYVQKALQGLKEAII